MPYKGVFFHYEDVSRIIEHVRKEQLKTLDLTLSHRRQIEQADRDFTMSPAVQKHLEAQARLEKFPPEICNLVQITTLNLGGNALASLPPGISTLTNLTELNLHANELTELPPEIGKLINLKKLDLSRNKLAHLPPEIAYLTNLESLDLRDNSFSIPPEILAKTNEPAAIISYYLQHASGRKNALNEAKMLLVGQGSVGKTSLVKQLLSEPFSPNERKTDGIEIHTWQISSNRQKIRLNVWDFGGQEIMHATHQFFLTKRSLYLLVLDARLDEDGNRVQYWLKMIESFGGDSPVIIVGNKIDQQPLDLDRRGLQAKYPQIKAIVETSCETGQGINELKAAIINQVELLDHLHDQLLLTWFEVKAELEQMKEDYIPYDQYIGLCKRKGIKDDISQRTLIRFLHDLGVVLNFQDDPRLEDTSILNPEWVTNGVYRILNYPALQSNGVLHRQLLSQILPAEHYPRNKHQFITNMMRKFELCFDFEGQNDERFLIPDLLPKEEPVTGDWHEALAFQYHYGILPGSVISRFIVRMNPDIHQNTYWRNGVVLAREGNEALIKADQEDKKIYIRVRGLERTRRSLLGAIRWQFDAIHQTIPGLTVAGKVPLPNHPATVIDYAYLLKLESKGQKYFMPEGPVDELVSVQQLLNGVDEPEQNERIRLHEILVERFSDEELRTLCFNLDVDYEDLTGVGKSGKARELIMSLERRGRLHDLVKAGKKLRADIEWKR